MSNAGLRTLLIVFAGIAALVLGLIVLVGNPSDPSDLLAGAALAGGTGLIAVAVPL